MILKMMMRVIKEDCTKKKEPFQIVEAVFLLLPVELCYYFVTRSNKNPHNSLNYRGLFWVKSTQSRDRTGMEVNPLVFETSASTNSAIWAFAGTKVSYFSKYHNISWQWRTFFLIINVSPFILST